MWRFKLKRRAHRCVLCKRHVPKLPANLVPTLANLQCDDFPRHLGVDVGPLPAGRRRKGWVPRLADGMRDAVAARLQSKRTIHTPQVYCRGDWSLHGLGPTRSGAWPHLCACFGVAEQCLRQHHTWTTMALPPPSRTARSPQLLHHAWTYPHPQVYPRSFDQPPRSVCTGAVRVHAPPLFCTSDFRKHRHAAPLHSDAGWQLCGSVRSCLCAHFARECVAVPRGAEPRAGRHQDHDLASGLQAHPHPCILTPRVPAPSPRSSDNSRRIWRSV